MGCKLSSDVAMTCHRMWLNWMPRFSLLSYSVVRKSVFAQSRKGRLGGSIFDIFATIKINLFWVFDYIGNVYINRSRTVAGFILDGTIQSLLLWKIFYGFSKNDG